MKKLFFLCALFAVGMAVTSCSSENEVQPTVGAQFDANGVGYVSVNINMPTSEATRANGDFSDDAGEIEDEYTVKNAILAIFTNSTDDEESATCVTAYTLNSPTAAAGTGQIRETYSYNALQLNASVLKEYVYALAILNNQGQFSVADGKLYCASNPVTTFSALKGVTLSSIGDIAGTNGLFMTNAPFAKTQGGNDAPTGLVQLTNVTNNIKPTSSAAEGEKANIYVERAAAKVTVASTLTGTTEGSSALTYDKDAVKWDIDLEANKFFPTRHVNTAWYAYHTNNKGSVDTYRFAESTAAATGLFRTTFGEGVNYTSNVELNTAKSGTVALTKAPGNNVYTFENTINESRMTWNNTTRVIISVPFNGGYNFWTVSDYGDKILTGSSAPKIEEVGQAWLDNATNKSTVETAIDALLDTYIKSANVSAVKGYTKTLTATAASANATVTLGTAITTSDLELANGDVDGNGVIEAADVTLLETYLNNKVTELMQTGLGVKFYQGGLAYYQVRIKHFGDEETPWTTAEAPAESTPYAKTYGASPANKFLGRYGVVRNNWYTINLSGIRELGEPTIPTPSDTPDDVEDKYLSVTVNVLRWAKRTQTEKL